MVIIFHMAPNGGKRHWDKFHLLADWLVEKYGAVIYVVGLEADRTYNQAVIQKMKYQTACMVRDWTGLTSLSDLVSLLQRCDLLICVNSFVMHLGVCLSVPMVAIVGATEPKIILPPDIPHAYSLYARDISLQEVIGLIQSKAKSLLAGDKGNE